MNTRRYDQRLNESDIALAIQNTMNGWGNTGLVVQKTMNSWGDTESAIQKITNVWDVS